ncbi:MAG: tandem-95 repeat protein, partial [Chitinivibrionales bacterium]|nr:tandem-95 repeat protein [Chitinivibrionales bacterium]
DIDVVLQGATGSSLLLSKTLLADNGALFYCKATNSLGSIVSTKAKLTVVPDVVKPEITTQPADIEVSEGSVASFTIVATGTDLTYQWKRGNAPIVGALAATYTLAAAKKEDNGVQFSCIVSNTAGSVESRLANLKVVDKIEKVTITKQPENLSLFKGESATFSVEVTGTNPTFQWRRNSVDLTGETTSSLTLKAVTRFDNDAVFSCVIKNSLGDVASANAKLTVKNRAPKLSFSHTAIVSGATINIKEDESFSCTVTGEEQDALDTVALTALNLPLGSTFTTAGAAGTFTYRPEFTVSKKNEEKLFTEVTFTAMDRDSAKTVVAFTIKVINVNRKPVYTGTSIQVQETQAGAIDFVATDPDAESLTWRITGNPLFGTLSAVQGVIAAGAEVTYTSRNLNRDYSESLQIVISDGTDETSGTVNIAIHAENDRPVILSIDPLSCTEDQVSGKLVIRFEDPEDGTTNVVPGAITKQGRKGSFSLTSMNYTPMANMNGVDSFSITVQDGAGLQSLPSSVPVTIQPVNDIPTLSVMTVNPVDIEVGATARITATAQDVDGDVVTWQTTSSTNNCTLNPASGSGSAISFTITGVSVGSPQITLTINDGHGGTASTQVVVPVRERNVAPIIDMPTFIPSVMYPLGSTIHFGFIVKKLKNDPCPDDVSCAWDDNENDRQNLHIYASSPDLQISGSGSKSVSATVPANIKVDNTRVYVWVRDPGGLSSNQLEFSISILLENP